MRLIPFFFFIILYSACTNDVTSIGQDLIDDNSFVEMRQFKIKNTSTVKLDSFATSTGNSYSPISKLLAGRLLDPVTGITRATPYFEIVPGGGSSIKKNYVYDSLTFHCTFTGNIWGDTTQLQTFRLCQMERLPILDKETDLIYNVASVPYKQEPLATYQVWPWKERLKNMWFRMDDDLGRELYNMLRRQSDEVTNHLLFLYWFKGLAFVPDDNNSCILGLSSSGDSLYMNLHFHDAKGNYTYKFNKSTAYNKYTFLNILNDAVNTPYAALTNQQENLEFPDAKRPNAPEGQAVTQAGSGYMIKMRIPISPASEKYKTIIKAEIELYPQQGIEKNFGLPSEVYVYKSDKNNRLISVLMTNDNKVITGKLVEDPTQAGGVKYLINITDYYNTLSMAGNGDENNYILVSIPTSQINNSLNRLVIDEIPVLHVYYAKYE